MIEKLPPYNHPGNYHPDNITDKLNEIIDVVNHLGSQKQAPLPTGMSPGNSLGVIPKPAEDEFWTINIPKGLTIEQAYADCKALFPCWRWTDTNFDQIINSERTSVQDYSIKVKATVEADENLKNLSANEVDLKGIKGITLLERLVLEKDYFQKTGKHLDINNWTLCAGSRYSGGRVPCVSWRGSDSGLSVDWCSSGDRDDYLRSREVVTL